jgi:sec-independent protein translocase protein TatA
MAEVVTRTRKPVPLPKCYNRPRVALDAPEKGVTMLGLFGPLGLPEMLIILAIVVLIFGANRLPELGKGIGAGIKNFKGAMSSDKDEK